MRSLRLSRPLSAVALFCLFFCPCQRAVCKTARIKKHAFPVSKGGAQAALRFVDLADRSLLSLPLYDGSDCHLSSAVPADDSRISAAGGSAGVQAAEGVSRDAAGTAPAAEANVSCGAFAPLFFCLSGEALSCAAYACRREGAFFASFLMLKSSALSLARRSWFSDESNSSLTLFKRAMALSISSIAALNFWLASLKFRENFS